LLEIAGGLDHELQRRPSGEVQRLRELEQKRLEEQKRGFQIPPQCRDNAFAPGCAGR
jgi:hypothetical protein